MRNDGEDEADGRRGGHVPRVHAVRAIAVLAVVLFHVIANHAAADSWFRLWGFYEFLAGGVDVFFVISGFVIRHTTFHLHGPAAVRSFLRRRVLRVGPLYWIVTGFVVILAIGAPAVLRSYVFDPAHAVASFLFVPWPRPNGDVYPPLAVGWSLAFEMLFYLVFALLMLAVPRQRVVLALTLIFAAGVLVRHAFAFDARLFIVGDIRVFEFVAGVIFADLWRAHLHVFSRLLAVPGALAGLAILVLSAHASGALGAEGTAAASAAGFVLISFAMFAWPSRHNSPFRPIWPLLDAGLTRLADASYAIYLAHVLTLSGLASLWLRAFGRVAIEGWEIALFAVLATSSGLALHRCVERPLLAWLRRRSMPPSRVVNGHSKPA